MQELDCTREVSVSRSFLQGCKARHPKLDTSPGYLGLLIFLITEASGKYRDEMTGGLILYADVAASFEGKEKEHKSKHYCVKTFLESFKRDIDPKLTWVFEARPDHPYCIYIITQHGLQEDEAAYFDETDAKRVYVPSGVAHNEKNERKAVQQFRERALAMRDEATNADQRLIMDYNNDTRMWGYYKRLVSEHYQEAREVARSLDADLSRKLGRIVHYNEQALQSIRYTRCQPFIEPRQHNMRMYGPGLQMLNSKVRKALCPSLFDLDLASNQAGIAAYLWQIDSLYTLLSNDGKLWPVLLDFMGVPDAYRQDGKAVLKDVWYAVMFGMPEEKANGFATTRLRGYEALRGKKDWQRTGAIIPHKQGAKFCDCPLVRDLIEARQREIETIRREGGAMGPYGWIENTIGTDDDAINKFLSYVFQAWELAIIAAAYKEAAPRDDFFIALYSFDGFSVDCDPQDRERIIADLQEAVNARAYELGIPTRLEAEK